MEKFSDILEPDPDIQGEVLKEADFLDGQNTTIIALSVDTTSGIQPVTLRPKNMSDPRNPIILEAFCRIYEKAPDRIPLEHLLGLEFKIQ